MSGNTAFQLLQVVDAGLGRCRDKEGIVRDRTYLINKKMVAKRAENMLWHKLPKSIYFRRGSLPIALSDLEGKKRAMVVTDRFLFNNGYADEVVRLLKKLNMEV